MNYKLAIKITSYPILFIFIILGLFYALTVSAESIRNFDVDIDIKSNSRVLVTEVIEYDFAELERRGIFRNIPISYTTDSGNTRSIGLKVLNVTRDHELEPYVTSKGGGYLEIKIGDPDVYITGSHVYHIVYEVIGALNYFDAFDEFYWNVTGHDWDMEIESATANILLPQSLPAEDIKVSCYQGVQGSKASCLYNIVGDKINFRSFGSLSINEGLTVAIGFPKGLVVEPTTLDKIFWWLKDNWVITIPIFVLLVLFTIWYKTGRDPKGMSTIIAEYEPPEGLTPTLVGSVVDEKVDNRDITAGLIYLAQQGFIKISRVERKAIFKTKDYELTLLKDVNSIPTIIEQDIAKIIFKDSTQSGATVSLTTLKKDKSLAKKMKTLKNDINQEMVSKNYYKKNPGKVRNTYISVGVVLVFLSFQFGGIFGAAGIAAGVISGILIAVFGPLMTRKTKHGAEIKDKVLGFKEFLGVTETDRLKFHNAPSKTSEQFMVFLPFAVAMGVEKEWAGQFNDIYLDQPNWYGGNLAGNLIAADLVNDLSGFTNKINSGFSQAASSGAGSSGGGFSGGGMGGGGGGSW